MKTKQWTAVILCMSVLVTGVMSISGCGTKVQAANLMEGIAAKPVSGKAADDAFKNSSADFAIKLFQQTRDDNKNSLSAVGHAGALHDGKRSEGRDSCANGSSARRRYSHGNAERISVFLYKGTALRKNGKAEYNKFYLVKG